jgi:Mrp family chromosome partitioning ATPase
MKRQPERLPLEEGLESAQRPLDILWTKFAGITGYEECVRILFTSPDHGTGTTTLACCTALGLARNLDDQVSLLETNIHAPAMSTYLGLPPTPGLTDCLDGRVEPDEVVRNVNVDGLHVLTAGTARPPIPGEIHGSRADAVFREVVKGSRYVIIDAPPVVERPEAKIQLEFADWIVLVIQARSTKRARARRAMRIIHESGTPALGVIVNRFQSDMPFGLGAGEWK